MDTVNRRKYKNEEINEYQSRIEDAWEELYKANVDGELKIDRIIHLMVEVEHAAQWKGWNMGWCGAKGIEWR